MQITGVLQHILRILKLMYNEVEGNIRINDNKGRSPHCKNYITNHHQLFYPLPIA